MPTMQQPGHIPMIQPNAVMISPGAWPQPTTADGQGMDALGNYGVAPGQF